MTSLILSKIVSNNQNTTLADKESGRNILFSALSELYNWQIVNLINYRKINNFLNEQSSIFKCLKTELHWRGILKIECVCTRL